MAVATPMHMIAPISEGTLNVVWVANSIQRMPRKRARQRHDDDKRIDPRLEVDHHQQVDQQDREHDSGAQPDERSVHALHLSAHDQRACRAADAVEFVQDRIHIARNAAQVTSLHVRVDIEDRLDVVVVDDLRRFVARNRRHIAQQLACTGVATEDGRALKRIH